MADHPRACGANVGRQIIATRLDGSSPRMRGKRCIICVLNSALRIIPAHAGQTNTDNTNTSVNADHPRACGANGIGRTRLEYPQGSSPRMRGKLGVAQRRERVFRIIPAHAGQTSPSPLWGAPCPDHPRACGANVSPRGHALSLIGSSPRMRGKRPHRQFGGRKFRIIPAHAGQTSMGHPTVMAISDHPRACGANREAFRAGTLHVGSSPRMRGKPSRSRFVLTGRRIIPAHAGQTSGLRLQSRGLSDHPRACGANNQVQALTAHCGGSSPRMRGKRHAL